MTVDLKRATDAVAELQQGERAWGDLPLAGRVGVLSELRAAVAGQASEWVEAASVIKQLAPGSPLRSEEWLSGPYPVLASAAALSESLEALRHGRQPGRRVLDGERARWSGWRCGCCRIRSSTDCCSAASRSTCGCRLGRRVDDPRARGARPSAPRPKPEGSRSCWVPGTSPRSGRLTSSSSCSPRTASRF